LEEEDPVGFDEVVESGKTGTGFCGLANRVEAR
jgi:hypothetical protein